MTKLKVFADNKLNIAEMTIPLCDRVENTVIKKEKCWLPAFSSFPTVFSKAFFFSIVKSWDCVVKNLGPQYPEHSSYFTVYLQIFCFKNVYSIQMKSDTIWKQEDHDGPISLT